MESKPEPEPEPQSERRFLTHAEDMSIKLAVHDHCKEWDMKDKEQCKKRKQLKKSMTQMMMEGQSLEQVKAVLV